MIIFGTRGVTYSSDKGQFTCPSCRQTQDYKKKRVRRFFTLYFIPLIPLDQLGEYVECQLCRGTYNLEVLDYDPHVQSSGIESEYQRAIKRVMVQMMLADGHVDDQEIETIREVYQKLSGAPLSREEVEGEIHDAKGEGRTVVDYLSRLSGQLNAHGKEMVVKAALLVAAADGEFQPEEQDFVAQVGSALDMSSAHLRGIVDEVINAH